MQYMETLNSIANTKSALYINKGLNLAKLVVLNASCGKLFQNFAVFVKNLRPFR